MMVGWHLQQQKFLVLPKVVGWITQSVDLQQQKFLVLPKVIFFNQITGDLQQQKFLVLPKALLESPEIVIYNSRNSQYFQKELLFERAVGSTTVEILSTSKRSTLALLPQYIYNSRNSQYFQKWFAEYFTCAYLQQQKFLVLPKAFAVIDGVNDLQQQKFLVLPKEV